ncbi:MAG: hypothetical protein HY000_12220, partial [Planctomycetes bacterium]|nr:hypothetical protein [Planctomycetota bacterium]
MAAVGSAKPGESESSRAAGVTQPRRGLQLLVFLTLWGTYAYFWQSRDWNTAGRLMLTYALVDRGTLRLDGLEVHAADLRRKMGDVAWKDGHFYM